jgi:hypothetical protein
MKIRTHSEPHILLPLQISIIGMTTSATVGKKISLTLKVPLINSCFHISSGNQLKCMSDF